MHKYRWLSTASTAAGFRVAFGLILVLSGWMPSWRAQVTAEHSQSSRPAALPARVEPNEAPRRIFAESADGNLALVGMRSGPGEESDQPAPTDLVLESRDTGVRRVICETPTVVAATLSPNGNWIAYSSTLRDLHVVAARSTAESVDVGGRVSGIAWSPDSARVVYAKEDAEGLSNLWILDPATRSEQPLTEGTGQAWQPLFSPKGDRVLYVSARTGMASLWLIDLSTGTETQITNRNVQPGRGLAGADPVPFSATSTLWSSDDVLAWSTEESVMAMDLSTGAIWRIHDERGSLLWTKEGRELLIQSVGGSVTRRLPR